jgi:D-glycero-beta-D-manno-heptose 1-phosphate adenylyltransferase
LGNVVSQEDLILRRREWKGNGKRVVFASGVFDLLHPGHIRLLDQARSLGDVLVVAVQSDASAGAPDAKGACKPVTPGLERMEIIAALAAVTCVVEFGEPDSRPLLAKIAPDVVVKGGSEGSNASAFREDAEAEAAGIKVIRIPLEPGYSTERLLERIQQTHA